MAKRLIPDESHFLMLASAGLELSGSGNNFPLDCSLEGDDLHTWQRLGAQRQAGVWQRFTTNLAISPETG
jgi:hypothetical protein